MAAELRYHRRFALLGTLVTLGELVAVGAPLGAFFHFHPLGQGTLRVVSRAAPVVLGGAWLIWWLALRWWRGPLDRAVRAHRAGLPIDTTTLRLAAHVTVQLPGRTALLRAAMIEVAALGLGALLVRHAHLGLDVLLTAASIAAVHGLVAQVFRALAWSWALGRVRSILLPELDPLDLFRQTWRWRVIRAGLVTGALAAVAIALFVLVFMRSSLEGFLRLEVYVPAVLVPLLALWFHIVRRRGAVLEEYLAAATAADPREQPGRDDPRGLAAYRTAQRLPYQLGGVKLALLVAGEVSLAIVGTVVIGVPREHAIAVLSEALIVTIGAALYDVLWHRATLRPLLAHLAARHRPSPDAVRSPFGLRARMLLFLGVLTLFAGTLSLLGSFVQYTALATRFVERESTLVRERLVAEVRTQAAVAGRPPSVEEIARTLGAEARRAGALLSFLPQGADEPLVFTADGVPPPLPAAALVKLRGAPGPVQLAKPRLLGTLDVVQLADGHTLGQLAVLYPGYWSRGLSFDPQVTVLFFFFALLLLASMGIVVLVASDLTEPIRRLEERAAAMARGDLNRPVVPAAGEADEVGRLTFAFEGMRRALNEKLRSSTEINLSLEAEVTRRTAELERRNKELKDALDALRRAQAELVRSEKMASMGRLVAGIAHEINNPVNAIVNTIGPLEGAIEQMIRSEDDPSLTEVATDARDMMRVIQSGARRTKEIVQALHNYSRGDDDTLVQVDLHRGLDESLDLLRHHLKHGIKVERDYRAAGRVLGNAGQLQQVFMNLLTNAAQAIGDRPGGGTIRIRTMRDGGQVVVHVSDDGPGIPEDTLPRIFDPFFTTKEVGQGSGMGLSIVHGIIERHGGSITVESQVARGTTFTVTLPVGETIARRENASPPTSTDSTPSTALRG